MSIVLNIYPPIIQTKRYSNTTLKASNKPSKSPQLNRLYLMIIGLVFIAGIWSVISSRFIISTVLFTNTKNV